MSLKSVQPSYGLQRSSNVAQTGAGDATQAASGSVADTVHLTSQGKMMSELSSRMEPTPEAVGKLSNTLAGDLKNLFRRNAVDLRGNAAFEVDSNSGKVSVKDDQPNAREIAALIESHPGVARQIHDVAALSSHLLASRQSADLHRASRVATSATQVSAFAADFDSRSDRTDSARDFSPISPHRSGSAGHINRAIGSYAAISGTYAGARSVCVIFNGADVQVRAGD